MNSFAFFLITILAASLAYSDEGMMSRYKLQVNQAKNYDLRDYDTFIKKEFRPQLNKNKEHFTIKITRSNDKGDQSILIKFDAQTYIIEKINNQIVLSELKQYSDSGLVLELKQLTKAFDIAFNEDFSSADKKEEKQNALKFLSFIFSDAARFSDINDVVNKLLTKNCNYQRSDYINLIRSWRRQSEYVNFYNNKIDNFYLGGPNCNFGTRYCLVSPITHEQVEKFSALKESSNEKLLPIDRCN
ncbi:MAG: hypothetical protein V4525_08225 [Pseudomonadota bacterium]